jgi:hypothetical protein
MELFSGLKIVSAHNKKCLKAAKTLGLYHCCGIISVRKYGVYNKKACTWEGIMYKLDIKLTIES